MYEHIDMKKTGILLKYRIEKAGYTVKDIQKLLQLSCRSQYTAGLRE